MHKLVIVIVLFISLFANSSFAGIENTPHDIYHGIDIDAIYSQSDWESKEVIKQAIDDYTLLLEHENKLNTQVSTKDDTLEYYDDIAISLIKKFYINDETHVKEYYILKNNLLKIENMKACQNKYNYPSGNLCDINSSTSSSLILKKILNEMIQDCKIKIQNYLPYIKYYK